MKREDNMSCFFSRKDSTLWYHRLGHASISKLRGHLVWTKGMEWNQGIIVGGLGMELDSFFNVFGGEEEWNQIIILIICLLLIKVN